MSKWLHLAVLLCNSGSSNADSGGILYATVAGVVERVNKLITVTPPKTKYQGEIGDVVVGRITEVQQKRWKVEVNSRLDAVLQLSSVNLPGTGCFLTLLLTITARPRYSLRLREHCTFYV